MHVIPAALSGDRYQSRIWRAASAANAARFGDPTNPARIPVSPKGCRYQSSTAVIRGQSRISLTP